MKKRFRGCRPAGDKIRRVSDGGVVTLACGTKAYVDPEDVYLARLCCWSLSHGYAQGRINRKTVRLHRLVLGGVPPKPGLEVDHKDGNRLNCRKQNLRWVTRSENNLNWQKLRNSVTGIKGVYPAVSGKGSKSYGYFVRFRRNGKRIYLGWYPTVREASIVAKGFAP